MLKHLKCGWFTQLARKIRLATLFLLLTTTAFAWPPGGNGGGGNGGGGNGGGGEDPPPTLPGYAITFLGKLPGGTRSYATAISERGDVVGASFTTAPAPYDQVEHAFISVNNGDGTWTMIDLHEQFVAEGLILTPLDFETLTGDFVQTAQDIRIVDADADGIVDFVQIVGKFVEVNAGTSVSSSYLYTSQWTAPDGSTVQPSSLEIVPLGTSINNSGSIVGTVGNDAAVWDEVNGLTLIGTPLEFENNALQINDSGQVLIQHSNYNPRTVRYTPGVGLEDVPLLSKRSIANPPAAINDQGQVACTDIDRFNVRRAVLYSVATGSVDLGNLSGIGSACKALNNHGDVLGVDQTSDGFWQLFLDTAETGMFNLEDQIINLPPAYSGLLDQFGLHMNDAGEICGSTRINIEAYVLTPIN